MSTQLEPIEAAPRNGSFVILHSEETGRYEVARWSRSGGRWEQEHGALIDINPTHWAYFPAGHENVGESDKEALTEFARPPETTRPRSGGALVAWCNALLSAMLTVGLLWLSVVGHLAAGDK